MVRPVGLTLQIAFHQQQGEVYCLGTDGFPVAGEVLLFGPDALLGGEAEPDGSDRFVFAAAVRAGDAGDA